MLALKGKALERLHAADAKELLVAKRKEKREYRELCKAGGWNPKAGSIKHFKTLVAEPDARGCQLWQGPLRKTTSEGSENGDIGYERGLYYLDEYPETNISHRIHVMMSLGLKSIPQDVWISPDCGDHLCHNLDHLSVVACGTDSPRTNRVPVRQFFCEAMAQDLGHKALELAADALLVA